MAGLDVAVQAVVRHVQLAVGEPLVERRVRVVEDRRERLVPVQLARLLGPEFIRIKLGPGVERLSWARAFATNGLGGTKRSWCSISSSRRSSGSPERSADGEAVPPACVLVVDELISTPFLKKQNTAGHMDHR
jgi:hypothetical protein